MNIYNIPRNMKGESRILMIFSVKALIYTAVGATIGLVFFLLLRSFNLTILGIVIMGIFGVIGFLVGTLKIPDSNALRLTQKLGGENIDDVVRRFIKFKMKKSKIYLYCKEETKK
ncbi:MAG: PrgI family protein [Clostridia bacterium]|nr:PrgI family protein [Clostridia bacterium]